MFRRLVIVVAILTPMVSGAQVTLTAPGVPQARASDQNYGKPRVADLEAIVISDGYQRAHVLTEGELSQFQSGQYWTLRQGSAVVLIIPGRELNPGDLDRLIGHRAEVRGIVRMIRPKEYLKGVDLDLIEDPSLPPMPPPMFEQGWPRISITALEIRDREYPSGAKPKETAGGIAQQILDDPPSYVGKKIRVRGQFRGRNLFGDLPANSARSKDDWVLKDGETAMWVTGKEPKGKGWMFDLDYKGDTKKWLEVEGKPEVANGIVYLKASLVFPTKPPGEEGAERPRR